MKIYLIGFMGCGKTTIGKRLAARLGFGFVDTDEMFSAVQIYVIQQHTKIAL